MLLNNQQIIEEIKKEIKICIEMNENENHNNLKPMGHCKSSAKGKIHSITGLPQETRKKSNKQPNPTPKATREGRNEEPQG